MKPIALIISVVLFLSSFSGMHPYHIDVTEIKHNAKDSLLELSCKLFAEDIEGALKKIQNGPVDVSAKTDSAKVFTLLEDYFKKRFILTLNGVKADHKFLGFEKNADAVWCYLEYANVKSAHKVCVENTILYDFIPEQTHMMHLITAAGRTSKKLNHPYASACFY